jgi:hypothetical protein
MTSTMDDMAVVAGGGAGGPPRSSGGVAVERMTAIQDYIESTAPRRGSDGVACFNHLYRVITMRVKEGIESGFFADGEFLSVLDVAFANRYFDALRASVQQPAAVPRSWSVLVERRSDDRVESIQFAVAGVNAHINLDLAMAVLNTCEEIGDAPDSGTQYDDYQKVNEIFAEEMRSLRQFYEDELERRLDDAAATVLDVVGNWSVEAARDSAWVVAEQLWLLNSFGVDVFPLVSRIDRLAALAGHFLLTPVR